ncbi:hypothetical protein MMYC01_201265 [Madurella mycetomatis]|uniref:Uncharacterized protein n=1 Tax=Madurella mycetomatis TaxID=100816 RepID=A0A175WFA1_9PEZI|nr:hypothetical protein MMYC01_203098 [Madurella mycetomatis]KXX82497.1 hypothetical protein MMYC01_201265 [Madurella mycetomatis]
MRNLAVLLTLTSPVLAGINWDVFEYGVVPTFKWTRPFPDDGTDPGGFDVNCRAQGTFHGKLYKLKDLPENPPAGLSPWQEAIDVFLKKRDYMGSWDGVDHKGQDREVVMMEWVDVPVTVRHWIEEQQADDRETNENKWMFAVLEKPKKEGDKIYGTVKPKATASPAATATEQGQGGQQEQVQAQVENVPDIPDKDKIVVFSAAAVYEILPLWVSKGSKCERELGNLAKYKPQAVDHSVLAWVVDHTKPQRDLGKRDITFKVEAMAVTETEEGKRARLMWERLHRAVKRNERKQQREERLKARKEMEEGRVRDEL